MTVYRVRKNNDKSTQLGCFKKVTDAQKLASEHPGYSVYPGPETEETVEATVTEEQATTETVADTTEATTSVEEPVATVEETPAVAEETATTTETATTEEATEVVEETTTETVADTTEATTSVEEPVATVEETPAVAEETTTTETATETVESTTETTEVKVEDGFSSLVKELQTLLNIEATGVVDDATLAACPTLKQTDRGPLVKLFQKLLVRHGYNDDVDGIFWIGTTILVKKLQKANSLTENGMVSASEWKILLA